MASKTRLLRIDLSQDLPPRTKPLDPEDVAQIFGGCRGEFVACEQNWQCCSNKCRKAWYHSSTGEWTWECLPQWATAP